MSTTTTVELTDMDRFLFKYLGKGSPVVPFGCLVTGGILASGLYQFKQANPVMQQTMMRARVISQGVTVALMMASLHIQHKQKALGLIPMRSSGI